MRHTSKWCLNANRLKVFDKQVFVIDQYGNKWWYLNGKYHREDGPAIEFANGTKEWYLDGELHRENGPAIEYANGDRVWFLNGVCFTKSEYWKELQK